MDETFDQPSPDPVDLQHEAAAALRLMGITEPQPGSDPAAGDHAAAARQFETAPTYPPSLADQANDPALTGGFSYVRSPEATMGKNARETDEVRQMGEREGLQGLRAFLGHFAETAAGSGNESDGRLAERARDISENLTYIGERELEQASDGIAADWKSYLDGDPSAQLFMWTRPLKSNAYMLDKVLARFSDDELERYRGRLQFVSEVTRYRPKTEPPATVSENHRVVMLDDWIETGRQMSEAYTRDVKFNWPDALPPPNVEIQLVTATAAARRDGIELNDGFGGRETLPVRSFFESRPMADGSQCVTGLHSSTDDTFEIPIGEMVEALRERYGEPDAEMPPLTNVVRPYRQPGYAPEHVLHAAAVYGTPMEEDLYRVPAA